MAQLCVDPKNMRVDGEISVSLLPPKARDQKHVPNVKPCLAGDLILYSEVAPDWISRSIRTVQINAGFEESHGRWTHAAVYLYDDLILEAVPGKGVRTRSIYDDVPLTIMRVRRLPDLNEATRYKIALCALQMLGRRYSVWGALLMGWQMRNGWWNPTAPIGLGENVICSRVYYDATVEITRRLLNDCPFSDRFTTPAHLSCTSSLDDVDIGWLKLV